MWLALVVVSISVAPNLVALTLTSTEPSPSATLDEQQLVASLWMSLGLQVALFAIALMPLLLMRRLNTRLFGPTRPLWTRKTFSAGALAGLAATFGSYGLNAAIFAATGSETPVRQQLVDVAGSGGLASILVFGIAVVAAPITEEIVFRGVLFRSLADRFGGLTGVVVSAAIFTAVHVEILTSQPLALAGIFVVGVVLADAYRRTGNLLVAIVGHAMFNATSLGLAVLVERFASAAT